MTMDAIQAQMEASTARPHRVSQNYLMAVATRWDVPVWALAALAHETFTDSSHSLSEGADIEAAPAMVVSSAQPETPAPDALRPVGLSEALERARRDEGRRSS
jgi:hypothetical protein